MAQDAPKRRFLSLIFLVSCISKSFLISALNKKYNEETKFSVTPSFVLIHSSDSI